MPLRVAASATYGSVRSSVWKYSKMPWGQLFPLPITYLRFQRRQPEKIMILIVEDDIDLAETCSMVLETCGYEVQIARDADEALTKIAEHKPDLLISDCIMPGRTGLELSQQLRSHYSRSVLPILLMSGSPRRQVASGGSYDAFISKPFMAEALLLEVKKLLNEGNSIPPMPVQG